MVVIWFWVDGKCAAYLLWVLRMIVMVGLSGKCGGSDSGAANSRKMVGVAMVKCAATIYSSGGANGRKVVSVLLRRY